MSSEYGIEEARKTLGPLVNRSLYNGQITYLTRNGRRVAAIVPLDRIKETAVNPTLTLNLPRLAVPEVDEWQAMPAGDERTRAARDAAAVYDTIATTMYRLSRQYSAVSEAIAEQDVTGETSPEAAKALAASPVAIPGDDAEGLRIMRLLADMAQSMRDQATAAEREADTWRARIDELHLGEAGAY